MNKNGTYQSAEKIGRQIVFKQDLWLMMNHISITLFSQFHCFSFYPSAKSRRGIAMSMSVGLLTHQCFRSTGRISSWISTIFGLWAVGKWAMTKTKRFFEIHIFRVKNGKISNRNCAFLAKSVFSHYRPHFLMNHPDFWFVSCCWVGDEEDKTIFWNSTFLG